MAAPRRHWHSAIPVPFHYSSSSRWQQCENSWWAVTWAPGDSIKTSPPVWPFWKPRAGDQSKYNYLCFSELVHPVNLSHLLTGECPLTNEFQRRVIHHSPLVSKIRNTRTTDVRCGRSTIWTPPCVNDLTNIKTIVHWRQRFLCLLLHNGDSLSTWILENT